MRSILAVLVVLMILLPLAFVAGCGGGSQTPASQKDLRDTTQPEVMRDLLPPPGTGGQVPAGGGAPTGQ